jgi:hypothetical protein
MSMPDFIVDELVQLVHLHRAAIERAAAAAGDDVVLAAARMIHTPADVRAGLAGLLTRIETGYAGGPDLVPAPVTASGGVTLPAPDPTPAGSPAAGGPTGAAPLNTAGSPAPAPISGNPALGSL